MRTFSPSSDAQVAGVEWCTSLDEEIQRRADEIGCLEIIPENFFSELVNFNPSLLFNTIEAYSIPVIVHSV